MSEGYNLVDCMWAIDPSTLDYQEWLNVGMALQAEGYDWRDWEEWSRQDTERYNQGECARKWRGLDKNKGITGGTLVHMAREAGWEPSEGDIGRALDWESAFDFIEPENCSSGFTAAKESSQSLKVIDPTWVESEELVEPGKEWQGYKDLIQYLDALFSAEDVVGYVCESWNKDGRYVPKSKGAYTETAGDIIARLEKYKNDFASSIGFNNTEAGAWVRFNPLDGKGVRNDNVVEFRYALVESDEMEPSKQLAIMKSLNLPVAALVHSGNKSIHAIVKVDAGNYDEYRKRVDTLYSICKQNGLKIDTQNKNPSRLSRMPGVMRGEKKQWLIATNIGCESWRDWQEWIAEQNDDLPDLERLSDVWNDLPELSPPLIEGVLRQGHKMLLAGPSKAGKSFALIELCIALAEGKSWLGWKCAQGRVLYVNLELDRASCLHRFKDVYTALKTVPEHLDNIEIWNLRGKSKPMTQLAPSLIRRALKTRPIAVIIDPIYKVTTGDENSADQMAMFCNQFDKVADSLNCAVIYCHHHSKGSQGQKRSMDRASGSGVFARDPDALLDMIELHTGKELMQQVEDDAVFNCCVEWLNENFSGWHERISQDDQSSANKLLAATKDLARKVEKESQLLEKVFEVRQKAKAKTAWRVEGTLREFPRFEPVNLWFDYPTHQKDSGALVDLQPEGEALDREQYRERGRAKKEEREQKRQNEKLVALREGMDACDREGVERTLDNVVERMPEVQGKQVSKSTVSNWVKKDKCEWCPIESRSEKGKAGILFDPELEAILEEWE